MKKIWSELWGNYKKEWHDAWLQYKTVIGPFIKGTASYIWLLIDGLIGVLAKGLFLSGSYLIAQFMKWLDRI